mgnify:CR=1 FL=1
MRAIKTKKLKREVKRLTQEVKPSLDMMLQRMWTGNAGEKKIYRDLAGTVRHAEGTTRRIYQDMKKES